MERKEVSSIEAAAYRMGHNPTSPNILGRDDYIFYPTHVQALLYPPTLKKSEWWDLHRLRVKTCVLIANTATAGDQTDQDSTTD